MNDSEINSLNDFQERLDALLGDAESYGIKSIAILAGENPIAKNCGYRYCFRGSQHDCFGLVKLLELQMVVQYEEADEK